MSLAQGNENLAAGLQGSPAAAKLVAVTIGDAAERPQQTAGEEFIVLRISLPAAQVV